MPALEQNLGSHRNCLYRIGKRRPGEEGLVFMQSGHFCRTFLAGAGDGVTGEKRPAPPLRLRYKTHRSPATAHRVVSHDSFTTLLRLS